MKQLACADLGMDCPFVGSADSAEALMQVMIKHGTEVHADMMAAMDDAAKADLNSKMMATMKDA